MSNYINPKPNQQPRVGFKPAETPVEALNQLNATLRKISYILEALNESVREANVKPQDRDYEENDLGFFNDADVRG
ncbi:hypothetical protein Cyagr_1316 [Cyanobium gracile PCC 6307]|uniref:Uncharacterized protein n=1 Tax=Cyanobium gracile (strain ATCC 27147 / PCC 6307) TaxID=292564 RepID=K9P524_CYAGP|nr:hypothetical protein Cyagr_1316 [Cyanobium gracile PCC 6307]